MNEETTRGLIFGDDTTDSSQSTDFRRSIAIVVGVDDYGNGIPKLKTAVTVVSNSIPSRTSKIFPPRHH